MDKVFEFFVEYSALIIWSVVVFVSLALAFPRWRRLYKIRLYYRQKKYELCLTEALCEYRKNPFLKSKTRALTYVLSCALALGDKDSFESNIVKITSLKPWYLGIKLSWIAIYHLDQGNIEEACNDYKLLCMIVDKRSRDFAKSLGDLFAHYDLSKPFTKDEIKMKMSTASHPALFRIYSKIFDSLK